MKLLLKLSLVALITVFVFGLSSCSKDTDPADVDVFIGTYKGRVSYTKVGEESKSNNDGSVTVTKVGSTYNFIFSDGIPALTGVKFAKKDDNTYVSIGLEGGTGITITQSKLTMLVLKNGATWGADCSR